MHEAMLVELLLLLLLLHNSSCTDLSYNVAEEKRPGTLIGDIAQDTHFHDQFTAQDHSQITFSQLHVGSSENFELFNISKTGKLYTVKRLDAEALCIYATECFRILKCVIHQEEAFVKILKIKVSIEDINDHRPEFPNSQVDLWFSETDGRGTKRSISNAIDKDVGILTSKITYELSKDVDEPFSLTVSKRVDGRAKLEIILDEKLDREVRDQYSLEVIAKDEGYPPQQSSLRVQISISDVNDNSPIFSQNVYNVSIKKSHPRSIPVVTLSATDLDAGENSRIFYRFSSQTSNIAKDYFDLNEMSGEIFLRRRFPSRQILTYKLFVDVIDGGNPPLSSTAVVFVNVINQQNKTPRIDVKFLTSQSENSATISEAIKVGSFIAYVIIIDDDIGQNGEISCELNHDKFQLQILGSKEYQVIAKNPIDREEQDHFEFSIVCQDKGTPPLKAERKFSIQVTDVNDVRPEFTKDTFKFLSYENQAPNFPVGFVNATDPDLDSGGELHYFMSEKDENTLPFQISENGLITTKGPIDRETKELYEFPVFVRDNGRPSLNTSATVVVEVMDENDNAPFFTFPSENPAVMEVYYEPQSSNNITFLKAFDNDSPRNAFLQFEIVGGNERDLFALDSYNGLLSFTRDVYRNDAGSYDLQFLVKDSGIPVMSSTTTLTLILSVSNDTQEMIMHQRTQPSDRIHLNLVIVIVLLSVIIAISISISLTVCIIQWKNQAKAPESGRVSPTIKQAAEQSLLNYSAEQEIFHTDPQVNRRSSEQQSLSNSTLSRRHSNERSSAEMSIQEQKIIIPEQKMTPEQVEAANRRTSEQKKRFINPPTRRTSVLEGDILPHEQKIALKEKAVQRDNRKVELPTKKIPEKKKGKVRRHKKEPIIICAKSNEPLIKKTAVMAADTAVTPPPLVLDNTPTSSLKSNATATSSGKSSSTTATSSLKSNATATSSLQSDTISSMKSNATDRSDPCSSMPKGAFYHVLYASEEKPPLDDKQT